MDGTPHISGIITVIQFSSRDWSDDGAQSIYAPFFPPDSVKLSDDNVQGVTDHVYHSSALGATFPANLFVDDNNQLVQPGTFDVFCETLGSPGLGDCDISLGRLSQKSGIITTPTSGPGNHHFPTPTLPSVPTSTPRPTAAPQPTATHAPSPTATPTPQPTSTLTATPLP